VFPVKRCSSLDCWLMFRLSRKFFAESRLFFWSAALGRVWPENGRAGGGRGLVTSSGALRTPKGGAVHRIPRFPPLADQVHTFIARVGCKLRLFACVTSLHFSLLLHFGRCRIPPCVKNPVEPWERCVEVLIAYMSRRNSCLDRSTSLHVLCMARTCEL